MPSAFQPFGRDVNPPRLSSPVPIERRHLLTGRLGGSASVPPLHDSGTDTGTPGSIDLLNARRAGMGTFFEVKLPAATPRAAALATEALDVIDRLEGQLTVYRPDSELSRINATAHLGPVEVEPGLFDLLETALEFGKATQGAYDVAIGALSEVWGFTRGPKRIPDPFALEEARQRSGVRHVHLDRESRTIRFDRPGVILNLGGIGKGFALDRAAETLKNRPGLHGALIHGGRSSLIALGSPGWLGTGWPIALLDPTDPSGQRSLGTLTLENRAMGASAATYQRFEANGRKYGHLIDPRTGEPVPFEADRPLGVVVTASSATEADALSTALFVMTRIEAREFLARRPDLGVLLIHAPLRPDEPPQVLVKGRAALEFLPG